MANFQKVLAQAFPSDSPLRPSGRAIALEANCERHMDQLHLRLWEVKDKMFQLNSDIEKMQTEKTRARSDQQPDIDRAIHGMVDEYYQWHAVMADIECERKRVSQQFLEVQKKIEWLLINRKIVQNSIP